MSAQLELALPDWTYHRGMPDRTGAARYTHLIRWRFDPRETMARGKGARDAGLRLPGAAKRAGGTVTDSRARILDLLSDGEPRTFHCIAVQLTGQDASALMGSPLEVALWSLVEDETVAWACEDGATFFLPSTFVEWPTS